MAMIDIGGLGWVEIAVVGVGVLAVVGRLLGWTFGVEAGWSSDGGDCGGGDGGGGGD